ncbi:hypothetical protein PseAD21_22535 [Pseudomonas sp. AD21]|uniref:hypothetical protein n=1 Tax=Pseudomonas sp. AD21 TaxID=396378 RepID=UPI000C8348AE|nr:hypothetical protein [Pseudomonas sp. AD21]PMQ08914.1 hypothetical protein PseAD21_22535 [Pseudomonas sp. AD21]
MNIFLSPQRLDASLEVARAGSSLILNGETFDFSAMADGDTLPASAISSIWFAGQVDKEGGVLSITLLLPIPSNFSQEQAFPAPLINVPEGRVALPQPLPIQIAQIQEPEA